MGRWQHWNLHGHKSKGTIIRVQTVAAFWIISYRSHRATSMDLHSNIQILRNDVWHKHISSKVFLFVWHLLRNRLLTKENLARRSILQSIELACATNCGNFETTYHLFIGCGISDSVWYHVRTWLGIYMVAPNMLLHHFVQFSYMAGMPQSSHIFSKVVLLACVWVLWKEGNNHIFKNTASYLYVLIDKVKLYSFL